MPPCRKDVQMHVEKELSMRCFARTLKSLLVMQIQKSSHPEDHTVGVHQPVNNPACPSR